MTDGSVSLLYYLLWWSVSVEEKQRLGSFDEVCYLEARIAVNI
jgi:hypothetical protein